MDVVKLLEDAAQQRSPLSSVRAGHVISLIHDDQVQPIVGIATRYGRFVEDVCAIATKEPMAEPWFRVRLERSGSTLVHEYGQAEETRAILLINYQGSTGTPLCQERARLIQDWIQLSLCVKSAVSPYVSATFDVIWYQRSRSQTHRSIVNPFRCSHFQDRCARLRDPQLPIGGHVRSSVTSGIVGVLLAVLVATSAVAQSARADVSKFLGNWKLNAAKSNVRQSQLSVVKAASGDITVTLQGLSQTTRFDGKERPSVLGSTAIWTETSPRTWKTVYRMANVDNNIDEYSLSADGTTLTMKTTFLVPKRSEQMLAFTRVSGGPGLFGVWKAETIQNDANEFTLSSAEAAHITINWPAWGGSSMMAMDGSEAPVTGDTTAVSPGMTASFKATGVSTFDITLKMNREIVTVAHCSVSADGRTLTLASINAPGTPAEDRSILVYERR